MQTTLEKSLAISDFQDLIYPITIEGFIANYWEKELLLIKREAPSYYESLLSIAKIDEVLDYHRPNKSNLIVVKNQEPMSPSKYENADGSLNLNQLYAAYGDGYTVVINGIDRFWKPIKNLCHNTRTFLSHKTVGNMYLTPENQQALSPHYDAHDVFVIQVAGKKHWKIYDATYKTPLLDSFQPIFQREHLKNCKEITLEAGDMMYIPRGVPHEASTSDESSLHLTIGIYPTQWIDFITKSFKNLAQNNIELRQALPIGFLDPNRNPLELSSEIKTTFSKFLESISEEENIQGALLHLSEEFRLGAQPTSDGHFSHLDEMHKTKLDSYLTKRANMLCKVQQIGAIARIIFPGNVIRGPIGIAPCLKFIAENEGVFQVDEIPMLSEQNKIKLAKRLIRGGLLKVVTI